MKQALDLKTFQPLYIVILSSNFNCICCLIVAFVCLLCELCALCELLEVALFMLSDLEPLL